MLHRMHSKFSWRPNSPPTRNLWCDRWRGPQWGLMIALHLRPMWPHGLWQPDSYCCCFPFEHSNLFMASNIQYLICRPTASDCVPRLQSCDPLTSLIPSSRSNFQRCLLLLKLLPHDMNMDGNIRNSPDTLGHTHRLARSRQLRELQMREVVEASGGRKERLAVGS